MHLLYFFVRINSTTGHQFLEGRTFESRLAFLETLSKWNQQFFLKGKLPNAPQWLYIEASIKARGMNEDEAKEWGRIRRDQDGNIDYLTIHVGQIID